MRFLSPLRYPGGKAKLAPFFHNLIEKNNFCDFEYTELYAGGAGVALDLLTKRYVSAIHLNDLSYPIYSFWYSILNFNDQFCSRIREIPISVDEWESQKEILENPDSNNIFEIGIATFYLNRTNRSGILNGGLIGGKSQNGKWTMEARFNKPNLLKRIKLIKLFRSRINIYNLDAEYFLDNKINSLTSKNLIYLDPPYYEKGSKLYENHYKHSDHNSIAKKIQELDEKYWVISYDNTTAINQIYDQYDRLYYDLNYSAQKKYLGSEVIILDPKLEYPDFNEIDILKNQKLIPAAG